jgi:tetratricopeptide (TPR) repeat protein
MDKVPDEVLELNSAAIGCLYDRDDYGAQQAFRKNAKLNPCFLTLHNLGAFYVLEGIVPKGDGWIRHAEKLGIKYLLKAASIEKSVLNLSAIAFGYLKAREYRQAVPYFEQALQAADNQMKDYVFHNNYGAALYSAGMHADAVGRFEKALDYCGDNDDRYEVNVSYAYSLQKVDDRRFSEVLAAMLQRLGDYEEAMLKADLFVLSYLGRDFQSAYALHSLFDIFHLDPPVVAMVLDLLIGLGKAGEAAECLERHLEGLRGCEYDVSKEVEAAQLSLASAKFQKRQISDYRYTPHRMLQCFYLGCPGHNPL